MIYRAEIVGDIFPDSKPRYGKRIGVFSVEGDNQEQIGEYERNYKSFFNTFFHFRRNGKDFALYSPDYSATRIMELPSCRDIGGEEPHSEGFCPVDYYVPTYIEQEVTTVITNPDGTTEREVEKILINNPKEETIPDCVRRMPVTNFNTGEKRERVMTYRSLNSREHQPFGFVAGCIWGDDSTYKIQFLDLSEAEKGIVKRDDRFGYIILPENQSLKEAIDMCDFGHDPEEEYSSHIRINIMQTFDLTTGNKVE